MRDLRCSLVRLIVVFGAAALGVGCGGTKSSKRYTRDEASKLLTRMEVTGLELGEFALAGSSSVIDGDTIRVKGLPESLRLLGIDAEETFKKDHERQAFAQGWEIYKKRMRGSSSRPVKMATPLGDEAKHWAEAFFDGVDSVKLERDHPGEIRDFFNRYLAYVLVRKDGKLLNYNVECVRAGYSPYFMKYGRSRRFHREFLQAEREAREAKRGIWRPGAMHYDDYDERLKWWSDREASITRFEREAQSQPDQYVALTRWDALLRLEQKVGEQVTVLGSVQEVKFGDDGPAVVKLARSRSSSFDIVFFDRDVLLNTGLQFKQGEYVQVRGVVSKYTDQGHREHLQMQVSLPGQVLAPSRQLEKLLAPEDIERAAGFGPTNDEGE